MILPLFLTDDVNEMVIGRRAPARDQFAMPPSKLVEVGRPHVDPLDFTRFFSECAPRLHRWIARRCGGDKTVAEDLVQEVFTQAWKNWERVGCYENPHAWVFLVARQMVARYRRSRARLAVAVPDIRDHLIGDTDGLLDFTRALPHLPLEHRRVAFLVFALEYTPAEAAYVLELNPSTVRSHIHRVRLLISRRRLIGQPGNEEG